MSHARRQAQLGEVLQRCGGTHTLDDVLELIRQGDMHSFVKGDSWVVAVESVYPRRTIIDVYMAVGDLEDVLAIEGAVAALAREKGATLLRAYGRPGFREYAKARGWKHAADVYLKELD